jgi:hypothetical protein
MHLSNGNRQDVSTTFLVDTSEMGFRDFGSRPREAIRLETVPTLPPAMREAILWQIDYECAQQNCGLHQTIYAKWSTDAKPTDVTRLLLNANPAAACRGGHLAVFDPTRIWACRL